MRGLVVAVKQRQRLDSCSAGDSFEALEREVALSALDPAHVRPMDTDHVGEGLLAEPPRLSQCAEVPADGLLEVPFHGPCTVTVTLLDGLQTYK